MKNEAGEARIFELLSRAGQGRDITVRDDQNDFFAFLDSARLSRRKGGRFRLIDTGKLSPFELEWLGEAGADIYTSDEARPDKTEIELLVRACVRGGAITAYFHQAAIIRNKEDDPTSLPSLLDIGRSGAYLHLSNRDKKRSLDDLNELATVCSKRGTRLVYYYHGRPVAGLEELARSGAWIHISDQSFESAEDISLLLETIKAAGAAGAALVLHVEKGLGLEVLHDLMRAGAIVLFKTPPSDCHSPFRTLERRAQRRRLDFRAYYLYTTILP
jgi:hypothetical protein